MRLGWDLSEVRRISLHIAAAPVAIVQPTAKAILALIAGARQQ